MTHKPNPNSQFAVTPGEAASAQIQPPASGAEAAANSGDT